MTDSEPIPVADPTWKRDFPYEASAEEDVTRREFARYLVAGAGAMAAGNVGLAIWTQLRTINTPSRYTTGRRCCRRDPSLPLSRGT